MKRDTIPCCPPTEPPPANADGLDLDLGLTLVQAEIIETDLRIARLQYALDLAIALRGYKGDSRYSTVGGQRVLVGS